MHQIGMSEHMSNHTKILPVMLTIVGGIKQLIGQITVVKCSQRNYYREADEDE